MTPRPVDNEDLYFAALQQMARDYPHYLECRGGQHLMELVEPFRVVDSRTELDEKGHRLHAHMGHDVYARRQFECTRCGKKRFDFYEISSYRGHMMLRRINAGYQDPPGFAILGLGRMPNARGLVMGMALEAEISAIPVRGRGRPKKGGGAA